APIPRSLGDVRPDAGIAPARPPAAGHAGDRSGAVARAGIRQHAGRAGRARLLDQSGSGETARRHGIPGHLRAGGVRHDRGVPEQPGRDGSGAMTPPRLATGAAIAAAAVALVWLLFVGLPRWSGRRSAGGLTASAPATQDGAVRRISARLFY